MPYNCRLPQIQDLFTNPQARSRRQIYYNVTCPTTGDDCTLPQCEHNLCSRSPAEPEISIFPAPPRPYRKIPC